MEKKEYLNEESYKKSKKFLLRLSLVIFIVGLLIGGSLIVFGCTRKSKIISGNITSNANKKNKETSEEIKTKLATAKTTLKTKKSELEAKGIAYDKFAEYTDGEKYDLKIITDVLNPSFDKCDFDEYKNNQYTSEYCTLKNKLDNLEMFDELKGQIDSIDSDNVIDKGTVNGVINTFNREYNTATKWPYIMAGLYIMAITSVIALVILIIAKKREITAFTVQQSMPVTQEGIEKITPTVANSVGTIASSVAKGIKSGINEANQESTNNDNSSNNQQPINDDNNNQQ